MSNRVTYVNVAMGPHAKVHDFPADEPATTAEPAPYRNEADFETWLANLRVLDCDMLFVSTLFPIVRPNIDHDGQGYPIERAWADAHPETFPLRYATDHVRIYAIRTLAPIVRPGRVDR